MFCPTEGDSFSQQVPPLYLLHSCTTSTPAVRLPQHSSSSSRGTHEARVSVAVRSACRSNPCTLCTRTYTHVSWWYVRCIRFYSMFPASHLESRHNVLATKTLPYNMACPTRTSRGWCHHQYSYCCIFFTADFLQQQDSNSSSNRTHEVRVGVAVRSACVGLPLEPFVHRTRCGCVFTLIPHTSVGVVRINPFRTAVPFWGQTT